MINMNSENNMDADGFIRKGLLLANQPEVDGVCSFAYSDRYLQWEKMMLKNPSKFIKKNNRSLTHRILSTAATIALVITILFGVLMLASPSVRSVVFQWFREMFATHDAYGFSQLDEDKTVGEWKPTYLPEGYIETIDMDMGTGVYINYGNDAGGSISLNYMLATEGSSFNVDNEGMVINEITIAGYAAHVYQSLDAAKKNAVVWVNEDAGLAFMLSSFETCELLDRIAESIRATD